MQRMQATRMNPCWLENVIPTLLTKDLQPYFTPNLVKPRNTLLLIAR